MKTLRKITQAELRDKHMVGLEDTPNLGTLGMQQRFDAHPDLNTTVINENATTQDTINGEIFNEFGIVTHSNDVKYLRLNKDNAIETSTDNVNWTQTASSGHIIKDRNNKVLPQRSRIKFFNSEVLDNNGETVVYGITGSKGDKGDIGITGATGASGANGAPGKVFLPAVTPAGLLSWQLVADLDQKVDPQDIKGPQGISGVQGIQGIQGAVGAAGAQGERGLQGVQGAKGDTGAQGLQGAKGDTGAVGAQGERGIQGVQGAAGAQGERGMQGVQGIQGAKGDKGEQGIKGDNGSSFKVLGRYDSLLALQQAHPQGTGGEAYAVGSETTNVIYIWNVGSGIWENVGSLKGIKGDKGEQGVPGVQGAQGAAGVTGAQGVKGDTGAQGVKGDQGTAGAAGAAGAQGVTGAQGMKGDTGAQGVKGDQGIPGAAGAQGAQGAQGIQGARGDRGERGAPTTINGKVGDNITLVAADVGAVKGFIQAEGNTSVGDGSMSSGTTGMHNTAFGFNSFTLPLEGAYNTAIGSAAGFKVRFDDNTAVGAEALWGSKSGYSNTAIGKQALKFKQSGGFNETFFNCVGLGYGARVAGSNEIQLGDSATTVYTYGAVQNRSDKRDKADIRPIKLGLDFINRLNPVDFKWDLRDDYLADVQIIETEQDADGYPQEVIVEKLMPTKKDGSKKRKRYHQGFVAQEVKEVADSMGGDFGGYQDHSINGGCDVLSLGYEEFIAPIIKAMQELSEIVEKQSSQIEALYEGLAAGERKLKQET